MFPFAFSGPTSWQGHFWVEDEVLVPFGIRLLEFLIWVPTALATQLMIIFAIYLVILIYRGVYFDHRTVRSLQWVGGMAVLASVSALVALVFDGWIITSQNAEYFRPIKFQFDSGEIGVGLIGSGIFLLGWVLRIVVLKDHENKEIV